jgi:DHA3 family tetracycline resistance protein-like MFS transporter
MVANQKIGVKMFKKLSAYRIYLNFSFLNALFSSLVFTVTMIYQVEVVHLNPLQLILAGTTFEVVNFIFQIPTGVIADLYSRKLSIILGMAMMGCGFIIQGSFPNYAAVLVSQIFWGVGSTFTNGAVEAWIAEEETSRNIHTVYLKGTQSGQIGSVIGILLSVVLGNYSLALPIRLGGGMLVVLSLFLAFFMPEYRFSPVTPSELNTFRKMSFTFRSGLRVIKADRILTLFLLIALFNGLASEGYDRLNTAHFLKDTSFPQWLNLKPVTWIGIFGILAMLISTGVMQIINNRKYQDDPSRIGLLLMTNLFYLVNMIIFGITQNFSLMLAAYLFLNMLKTINKPIMNSLANNHIQGCARATVFSTNEQMNSLGEVLGGPIIGIIANKFSIGAGITSTAFFLLPIPIIFDKLRRDTADVRPLPPS